MKSTTTGKKKRNQDQHCSREDLLSEIRESSFDGIIITDKQGIIKFASRSLARIFGYSESEYPTRIQELAHHIYPDPAIRERVFAHWDQDIKLRNAPERILPIIRKDGEQRWCRFKLSKTRSGNVILNIYDVTEQKHIQDRDQILFTHAPDAIYLVDPETLRILDFNDAACELLGYPRDEFRKMKLSDFAVVRSHRQLKQHVKEIMGKGSELFESKARRKDGELRDVQVHANVATIAGRKYYQCIVRDITEQNHIQSALRDSEETFRNLAEHSPNMIFIQKGKHVLYVNERCEQVFGYTRKEFLSPDFNWLMLIAPEHLDVALSNSAKRKRGQTIPTSEYTLITKSGKRIDMIISATMIRHKGMRAMLGIVTDVSDLKRSNAELMRQQKELESKHAALKEVLAEIEAEKLNIRKQVTANVEKIITPVLRRLKTGATSGQARQWDLLESSLGNLTSEFGAHLSGGMAELSPGQIEISNMIRRGMTSKEIAETLHLSLKTIETQRNRIRKKFGISRQATNLVSFLQNLS